jgi:hypothetical protein
MGRYRRRNNRGIGIGLLFISALYIVISIITAVIKFIEENVWVTYLIFGVIVIIVLLIASIKFIKYRKYTRSDYYVDTKTPYHHLKRPGVKFEFEVYNKLKRDFQDAKFIINALIPRKDTLNQYFEIDIIMFSKKGIFVIELKDWDGFIHGNLNDKEWEIGIKNNNNQRSVKRYYSPYRQNEKHIEDLRNIYDFDYMGHIIFSDRGDIGEGFRTITYYQAFVDRLNQMKNHELYYEIDNAYKVIKASISTNQIGRHIDRIKYNESKHDKL